MKIAVSQLTIDPRRFLEDIPSAALDLDTDVIKFSGPVRVAIDAWRITNAVSIDMSLRGTMSVSCGRCLEEIRIELDKQLQLNYHVEPTDQTLDLDPDIREEVILDYPLQMLCKSDCKGLCSRCGKNLNEGGCSCATTEEKTL